MNASETDITPAQYGVGARFTLSVYADEYVSIILDALAAGDSRGLTIETGDISTYVSGPEQRIYELLLEVISHAAQTGVHLSASILFSRGCPGELQCELPEGVTAIGAHIDTAEPVGVRARAHWSLYPLGVSDTHAHMPIIYSAISEAKSQGIYKGSDHYATRLDGDLSNVLALVMSAWAQTGADVQHVVSHVTISINSPSEIND